MTIKDSKYFNIWALRAGLVITILILLLSWTNHMKIPYIILRGAVSFVVIYALLAGSWYLFKKNAPYQEEQEDSEYPPEENERGVLFDAAVGDETPAAAQNEQQNNIGEGVTNLDADLADSGENQNSEWNQNLESGQNMGFTQSSTQSSTQNPTQNSTQSANPSSNTGSDSDSPSASQVDPRLIDGLPDSERQAEIVRRMGWEDE